MILLYGCGERKAGHNRCKGIMNFLMGKQLKMKKEKGVKEFYNFDEKNFKTISIDLSEGQKT